MKPLSLRIQAFGPFAEAQTLDFKLLGDNPLFLINGTTGSGKSTLLDAMCFALYGKTSGAEREAAQMRCDHANADTITELEFIFSVKDSTYKVQRQPMQERAKARGEGTTVQQTEANLWRLENEDETLLVSKSAQQVNQQLQEIIGLDAEQFRQVMILPQGKFRDFLLADSSQRERIFSTLFQTHIYQRLEEKLKQNKQLIDRDNERIKETKNELLTSLECEDSEALSSQLLAANEQVHTKAEARDNKQQQRDTLQSQRDAATSLHQELKQLRVKEQALQKLELQTAEYDEKRGDLKHSDKAMQIKPLFQVSQQAQTAYQEAHTALQQAQESLEQQLIVCDEQQKLFEQATQQEKNLPQQKLQLDNLQRLLPLLNDWQKTTATNEQCQQTLNNNQQQLQEAANTLASKQNELTQARQQHADLITALQQLAPLEVKHQQQLDLGKQLKALADAQQKLTQLEQQQTHIKEQGTQARQAYTQQNESFQALEKQWFEQQAAWLAKDLNEHEACPVCGSKEHPSPAQPSSDGLIDKTYYDAEKLRTDELREQLQLAISEYKAAEKSLIEKRAQYQELANALGGNATLSIEQLRHETQHTIATIKQLHQQQEHAAKLTAQITQLDVAVSDLSAQHAQLQQTTQTAATQLAVNQESLLHLEKQLPEDSRSQQALNSQITQLNSSITDFEKSFQETKNRYEKSIHDKVQQQERLNQKTQELQLREQENGTALQTWQQAVVEHGFTDAKQCLSAMLEPEQRANLNEDISQFDKTTAELKAVITEQQNKLAGQATPDLEAINQQYQAANTAFENSTNQWSQAKSHASKLADALERVKKMDTQLAQLSEKYRLVGTLADCATGKNGRKISLQRFVLGVLLDDVLIEASQRLLTMSKGRYRLLRNQEKSKGNKGSGLDLLVEDNHTGKTRAAATLSGGESFIAALALALGLSDVVQAYAGGIQLDALFVDEGFGSLDPEALDLALSTLIDLQTSGKMIGIISHVTELKEQMALRVDVKASPSGSVMSIAGL